MGQVGFIGLGDMGVPMASRLARAGLSPLVWARRAEPLETVVALGAVAVDSADDVFRRSDHVILMLANAAAMDVVLGRGTPAFAGQVADTTVIHMGTTPPGYSVALEADILAAGGRYAEVPVSGSTGPAETGDLVAMAAGDPDVLASIEDIVGHMCRATVPCGAVPKALQMKLAVNTYLGGLMEGLFEAFHFAATADLNLETLAAVLEAGPMSCDVMRMKLPKLLSGDHSPQASIRQAVNNTVMITDEADRIGAHTPTLQVMRAVVEDASAQGMANEDVTAITKTLAARAAQQ
ncbi:MAG: NAD(P)-dependent oxidoreductase [Pseudomonadota bacterium]